MKIKKDILFLLTVIVCVYLLCNEQTLYADEDIRYMLRVNVAKNTVMVYGKASDGAYSTLLKTMLCSTSSAGREMMINATVQGKEEWKQFEDGNFVRYASVCDDGTVICSALYSAQKTNALITEKYNNLGKATESRNVLLSCADAKWIYDNCVGGTLVEFYADSEGNTGMSIMSMQIPADSENAGWDPTDDAPDNPWKKCSAVIEGVKDIRVVEGQQANLLENVKAYDTCGNDITSSMLIMGNYDFNRVGDYEVTYYVKDAVGSVASNTVKITVIKDNRVAYSAQNSQAEGNGKNIGERLEIVILLAILSFGLTMIIIRYTKKD